MEKIKILLVEDEILLLQGLRKLVNWETLGFTICATASSYLDAVSAAYLCKPDLLITDIMLGQNQKTGLELVQYLSGLLPEMQSVMLTGYDRFEYAERAIEYSVKAYLLKPVTPQELTACLEKVRAEFDARREEMQSRQEISRRLQTAQPFLFDWFLSCEEDAGWRQFFGLTGEEQRWQAVVVLFPEDTARQLLYETFLKLDTLKNIYHKEALSFFRHNQIIYVLSAVKPEPDGRTDELAQMLARYCEFNGMTDYVIGIGREAASFRALKQSYDEAVSACQHIAFLSSGKCAYYADIVLPMSDQIIGFAPHKERLRLAVSTGHADEAVGILRSTLQLLAGQGVEIATLRAIGIEALVILNELSLQNDLPALSENVWRETVLCDTLDSLCNLLATNCNALVRELDSRRAGHYRTVLNQVRRVIDADYAQNLTLGSLAKLAYLSPPYLSTLFQEEFGVSVKDYLTGVRVEAAKRLLTEDYKVYEVAKRVGYTDSRYFSQVFRKYVGMTPLDFRAAQRNLQNQGHCAQII